MLAPILMEAAHAYEMTVLLSVSECVSMAANGPEKKITH